MDFWLRLFEVMIIKNLTEIIILIITILLSILLSLYVRKQDNKYLNRCLSISKSAFFVGVNFISLVSIGLIISDTIYPLFMISRKFEIAYFIIMVITIKLGFITFYAERGRLISELKKEKKLELELEKERENEFDIKCKNNAWYLRVPFKFFRQFYKGGPFYSGALLLSILTGSIIQLAIIGDYYFWTDEVFSFNAAKMILEKGEPLFDSGLYYGRASIYHHMLAGSMYLFGIDEFGSRIINVFINVFTTLLIYFILKDTSKKVALFGAFLFLFSNITIVMTIETRFYGFFTLAFLAMSYTYHKAFMSNLKEDFNHNLYKKLKYDWKWLILFLLSTYIAYNTHNFFFIFIFGLTTYYMMSLLLSKTWKINIFFSLCCVAVIFAGAYYLSGTFNLYNAYFEAITLDWAANNPRRPGYYINIIQNNLPLYSVIFITTITLVLARVSKAQRYYFAILLGGLSIISPQRAVAERYMFFLIPIIIILIAYSFYYLYLLFKEQRMQRYLISLILIIFVGIHLSLFITEVKGEYQNGRLAWHKKLPFFEVMKIIDEEIAEGALLLADYHAAFTLIAHGYDVKYIVISENREHTLKRALVNNGILSDHYFNVPFLIQENKEYQKLISNKKIVLVNRGSEIYLLDGLDLIFEKRPNVHIN